VHKSAIMSHISTDLSYTFRANVLMYCATSFQVVGVCRRKRIVDTTVRV